MTLKTQKGRQQGARRFLVYGPEGVGKTTLAASAPGAILADIEEGSHELDAERILFGDAESVAPSTWDEFIAGLRQLAEEEHGFKSLVVDSLEKVEALIWRHCCTRDRKGSIEDYGYGKGYVAALDVFRTLLNGLESLQKRRGMNIILIGHAQVRTFRNPDGEDFDRFGLRVHQSLAGLAKEWADVVGFATFETFGQKSDPKGKAKGVSTGRRVLRLAHGAAYDAKSRIAMPAEIALEAGNPWAPIQAAMEAGTSMSAGELQAAILVECDRIGDDELAQRVGAACKGVSDAAKLTRYLMDLKGREPVSEAEDSDNG